MSLKYGFLSVLAFCVCLFTFSKSYEVWTQPLEQIPQKSVEKKAKEKLKIPLPMEVQKDPNSIRSYIFIAEKNIFSPDRKDFPIVTVNKSDPATRPQVILYGVTIAGDYQVASIASPGRALRKGERETLTLKLGEQIGGGYKLAKIQPDRITMESNGDSFDVLLYDSKSPKKRMEVKREAKPATVMNTQPSPAPPSPPAAAQATAPVPAPVEKAPSAETAVKPKEPQQQQIAPPTATPTPRPIPPLWQRRRGMPAYPPTSPPAGVPGQTTQ